MPDNKITYTWGGLEPGEHPEIRTYNDILIKRAGANAGRNDLSPGRIGKQCMPMELIDFNNSLYQSILWDFFKKHFVDWITLTK